MKMFLFSCINLTWYEGGKYAVSLIQNKYITENTLIICIVFSAITE